MSSENLDRPIWGCKAIARAIGLIPDGASVEEVRKGLRSAFYQFEQGYWDVDKVGRRYRSTPRRLQRPLVPAKG
jgi:hypothetical protein